MMLAIAKKYRGVTANDHKEALEWCKACIQKRIDEDHLQNQVDWSDLVVNRERIDDLGWYCMICRLPLKEQLF